MIDTNLQESVNSYWNECELYRLVCIRNSTARLLISPDAGRIISYSLSTGENLLFVNESEFEKNPTGDSLHWINFGGIRFHPAPQSSWAKTSWARSC